HTSGPLAYEGHLISSSNYPPVVMGPRFRGGDKSSFAAGATPPYLHVPSIAVSISLIDLSSEASAAFCSGPHSAAAARVTREVPSTSREALQNMFLTLALLLSSAPSLMIFLSSPMVVSRFLVAIPTASLRSASTVSQSSAARAGAPRPQAKIESAS